MTRATSERERLGARVGELGTRHPPIEQGRGRACAGLVGHELVHVGHVDIFMNTWRETKWLRLDPILAYFVKLWV